MTERDKGKKAAEVETAIRHISASHWFYLFTKSNQLNESPQDLV